MKKHEQDFNGQYLIINAVKKLLILKRALEQLQEEDPSKPSNPTEEVYESLSRICGTRADDLEDLWDNRDFKEEAKVNIGRSACTVPTYIPHINM